MVSGESADGLSGKTADGTYVQTSNGLTVTVSEANCTSQALYLGLCIENEEDFRRILSRQRWAAATSWSERRR